MSFDKAIVIACGTVGVVAVARYFIGFFAAWLRYKKRRK